MTTMTKENTQNMERENKREDKSSEKKEVTDSREVRGVSVKKGEEMMWGDVVPRSNVETSSDIALHACYRKRIRQRNKT